MDFLESPELPTDEVTGAEWPRDPGPEPTLSIADAARALRLSPATVRRYIAEHGAHVETASEGHHTVILLRSFPTLARIRDLRAQKLGRDEIDSLIGAPVENGVAEGHLPAVQNGTDGQDVEAAFEDLRRDFAKVKQELRDNELVVRQSLSSILFLIEKYTREIEYHASEERIANKERDLRRAQQQLPDRTGGQRRARRKGLLSALAAMIPTPSSSR